MLLATVLSVKAQHTKPSFLYWVVETNIYYPRYTIVKFYDQQHVMVHEIKLNGVYIDIRVPKQKRKLDRLLRDYHDRALATSGRNKSKRSI
jgi:hypothetical protein